MRQIHRIMLALAMSLLAPAVSMPRTEAATGPVLVAIQPLGEVSPALVRGVVRRVTAMFAVRVVVLDPRAMPAEAYYRPRGRYRAERILDDLKARTSGEVTKVLALTARDVSTSKGSRRDWGVVGLAELGRRPAVVSTHRLGGRGTARGAERLNRVAVHELGHTFGLPHCRTSRCVMQDAGGTVRTIDRSTGDFCGACRMRIGTMLRDRAAIGPHGAIGGRSFPISDRAS